jgi:hypothetical protein
MSGKAVWVLENLKNLSCFFVLSNIDPYAYLKHPVYFGNQSVDQRKEQGGRGLRAAELGCRSTVGELQAKGSIKGAPYQQHVEEHETLLIDSGLVDR